MPGATPTYGLPYPLTTDSPHGPNQIKALADEVEVELARIDAARKTGAYNAYVPVFSAEGGSPATSVAQGGWHGRSGERDVNFWARVAISNAGTGRFALTLPRTAARVYVPGISGWFLDVSAVGVYAVTGLVFETGRIRFAVSPTGFLSQTNPVVTGTNDEIVIGGTYEAATDNP